MATGRDAMAAALEYCDSVLPRKFLSTSTPRRAFEVTKAFCYRGALGSQAATLRTLAGSIEMARNELADMWDEYQISTGSLCGV